LVDAKPLYIFFDYQDGQNQTPEKVIASLLKQFIYSIGEIPSQIVTMYNEAKKESPRPIVSAFVDVFITYVKSPSYVIFFDALDECNQQGFMISVLVQRMYNSGIKVFITHRPHILRNPENSFEERTRLEIRAHNEDIESHVAQQLRMAEKAQRLEKTFKDTIVKELRDKANGMYDFSVRMILITGSCLQIFNWNMFYVRLANCKWKWH
jgi:hypothetical protein